MATALITEFDHDLHRNLIIYVTGILRLRITLNVPHAGAAVDRSRVIDQEAVAAGVDRPDRIDGLVGRPAVDAQIIDDCAIPTASVLLFVEVCRVHICSYSTISGVDATPGAEDV